MKLYAGTALLMIAFIAHLIVLLATNDPFWSILSLVLSAVVGLVGVLLIATDDAR